MSKQHYLRGVQKLIWIVIGIFWICRLSGQSYFLNGTAVALGNDCYQLTTPQPWQNGTVWYSNQLDLTMPFVLEFDMYYGNLDVQGADGMVFVLQTVGTNATGLSGGGMGYQGFNPSLGIEFDTYVNADMYDPNFDHIAFLRNGNIWHNSNDNLAGPVAASPTSNNIEDGTNHQVKITWEPNTQMVSVYFDCVLRLTQNIDLVNDVFQSETEVYWGFTGATGGEFNDQRVCLDQINNNAPNNYSVCSGDQVQLIANGSLGGEIEWFPSDGLDDPTSFQPIASPIVTTEYCYTYTDFCGLSSTYCSTVEVIDLPSISLANDTVFCADDILNVPVQLVDAADFFWNTLTGQVAAGTTASNLIVETSGVYVLTAETNNGICSTTDSISITINALPDFEPLEQFICPGESIILQVPPPWELVEWWNGASVPFITVNEPGGYSAWIEELGCNASVIFDVLLYNVPNLDLGPDINACADDLPILIDANVAVDWGNGIQSTELSVDSSGQVSAEWTNGSCFARDTLLVNITEPPAVILTGEESICPGESLVLSANYSGLWSNDWVGTQITVSEAGLYAHTLTLGPCEVVTLHNVSALEVPMLELGPDRIMCEGDQITLGSEAAGVNANCSWNTGEELCQIEVNDAGFYLCSVSNTCGAIEDSVFVFVQDCLSYLFIPNSFTPNGDGINDFWQVQSANVEIKDIKIYNRWGLLVFETSDPNAPWLGDHAKGEYFAANAVYIYTVQYTDKEGNDLEKRGVVSLIR